MKKKAESVVSIETLNELCEYVREKIIWCKERADALNPATMPTDYMSFRRMENVYTDMLLRIQAIIYWPEAK